MAKKLEYLTKNGNNKAKTIKNKVINKKEKILENDKNKVIYLKIQNEESKPITKNIKTKIISDQEIITIGLYGEIASSPKYKNYIRNGAISKLNNYSRKYGHDVVGEIIKTAVKKKNLPFSPFIPFSDNKLSKIRKKSKQYCQKYKNLF